MIKTVIKIITGLLFLSWAAYFSACFTVNLPTFHLDGAFQTSSQLFRLEADQTFGKDFFSYLGVGVITSLYPFFRILGSNLAASIFASHFVTILYSCLSFTIIYRVLCPNKSFLTCFCICGTIYSTLISLYTIFSIKLPLIDYSLIDYSLYPGNSLRSIRAFIPYLVTLFLILSQDSLKSGRLRFLFRGLLFGFVLLWSNDYALSTLLSYLVTHTYFLYSKRKSFVFIFSDNLRFVSLAFISYFFLIYLITHDNLLNFVTYTVGVSKDQLWYFAPYTSDSRIFNLFDLLSLFYKLQLYPSILILIFMLAMVYTTKSNIWFLLAFTGISALMGGVVASVGGHIDVGYFYSFRFWLTIVLFSSIFKALELLLLKIKAMPWIILISLVMCFALLLNSLFYCYKYRSDLHFYKNNPSYIYVAELGGYLPKDWSDYIDLARRNKSYVYLEEYSGIWNAINRSVPIWPVDSVIHALGQTRKLAQQEIDNADLVITTKPSLSEWQLWSFNNNFWFYNKVISEFTPIYYSPTTVVWQRGQRDSKESFIQSLSKQCSIESKSIKILSNIRGFYRINFEYEIKRAQKNVVGHYKNHIPNKTHHQSRSH